MACMVRRAWRVTLSDADHGTVVERAEHGEVVVVDVVDEGLEEREEDALCGLSEEVVFQGEADDGGRVDQV